jgi:hypothetical protein
MSAQKKSKGFLALGVTFLFLGICAVTKGWVSSFGMVRISGGQAKAYGALCIIFGLAAIITYFRPTKP